MSNGGALISEYRINIAEQGGTFNFLDTTSDTSYIATSLTFGTTYEFKIEAKNEYGYSVYSSTLSLLSAFISATPTSIVTTIESETVKVAWSLSSANGTPITSYKVYI